MRYRFYTADVFTDRPFGGNQLAVLPEAQGLSSEAMQKIAAEFNYAETTFVLPPRDPANTAEVRIFTPREELPFAGHPNIGTAIVLAATGALGTPRPERLCFEEKAGLVPISLAYADGRATRAEFTAPVSFELGPCVEAEEVAPALSLDPGDILSDPHPPRIASAGIRFLCARLRDRGGLARIAPRPDAIAALLRRTHVVGLHVFTTDGGEVDLRMRMFAPLHGIAEDAATGSAAAAMAGLMAANAAQAHGEFALRMVQGLEMGRPSRLDTRAVKRDGKVVTVHVAGAAVLVMEGAVEVPDELPA
jgi:trans-2,3-dihydro-3-hydroxyanthranilate isomerase